jgi:hypothetical protein
MKNLLLASLITLAFLSCKKETPEPTPATGSPVVRENYVVLNGDGHTDDTIHFNKNLLAYPMFTGSDTIIIQGEDSLVSGRKFVIELYPLQTGSHTINASGGLTHVAYNSGAQYFNPNLTLSVTKAQASGGYVEGSYSGTLSYYNPTQHLVTVTGKFSVIRQ